MQNLLRFLVWEEPCVQRLAVLLLACGGSARLRTEDVSQVAHLSIYHFRKARKRLEELGYLKVKWLGPGADPPFELTLTKEGLAALEQFGLTREEDN